MGRHVSLSHSRQENSCHDAKPRNDTLWGRTDSLRGTVRKIREDSLDMSCLIFADSDGEKTTQIDNDNRRLHMRYYEPHHIHSEETSIASGRSLDIWRIRPV